MEKVYVMLINHCGEYYMEGAQILVFKNREEAVAFMYESLRDDYYEQMDPGWKEEFDEAEDSQYPSFEWHGNFSAEVYATKVL